MPFEPAHATKHISALEVHFGLETFHLSQTQTLNSTTGTTLWLGAQCLSAYIAEHHRPPQNTDSRAIELGSGVGLCSLVLQVLGYSTVYATDTRLVIASVLARNISANSGLSLGSILVRELDWHVPPENWSWSNDQAIASASTATDSSALPSPLNLIISSDTVYSEPLVQPLLRTLHELSSQSIAVSESRLARGRPPLILLCLERRDPLFVDSFLAAAREQWGFSTEMVSKKKIGKTMAKYASDWAKNGGEWDGVEIWKLRQ